MSSDLVVYAGRQPRERYLIDGRPGVGVSTVLVESGARPYPKGPVAAIRDKGRVGSLVHALIAGWWVDPKPKHDYAARVAIETKRRGIEWDPATVNRAGPYWNSFIRLLGIIRVQPRLWEHVVVVNDLPLVAGTLDLWGDVGRRRALIDFKTRAPIWPGDSMQTQFYLDGLRRAWPELEPTARGIVELRPNKDPRLHWCTDDGAARMACRRALERWVDARASAEITRGGKPIHWSPDTHIDLKEQEEQHDDPWTDEADESRSADPAGARAPSTAPR